MVRADMKFLGKFTWKSLTVLRLDEMIFCERGLRSLLSRHAKTLKSLAFCNVALWDGSFRSLLEHFREHLTLEEFTIRGLILAFHVDAEAWVFHPTLYLDFDGCHSFDAYQWYGEEFLGLYQWDFDRDDCTDYCKYTRHLDAECRCADLMHRLQR